jgi:hypothetical protein
MAVLQHCPIEPQALIIIAAAFCLAATGVVDAAFDSKENGGTVVETPWLAEINYEAG